jgi:hypothetical protein
MNQSRFAFINRQVPTFVFGVSCLIAVLVSVNVQKATGQPQGTTKELARSNFSDGAVVSGTGFAESLSGVTIACLSDTGKKVTKFVVSIAAAPDGPDARSLKVLALDKAGNEIAIEQSAASATGTKHMVTTFVCIAQKSSDKIGDIIVAETQAK